MEDKPFYTSDWHIHSVASYDAHLHVADLVAQAEKQGLTDWGLTDHVNVPSWIHFLLASRELVKQYARPGFHFGVELTTISGYLEAYDRRHGTKEGYEKPGIPGPEPVAFPLDAGELDEAGVEYVIGAAHWILNGPRTQEIIVADTPVTLFIGEDEQRPLAERVARFLPKVNSNYTIIDTKEFELKGISPEFRGSISHHVMRSVNARVDAYMELFLRHPLSIRRYYRQFDY